LEKYAKSTCFAVAPASASAARTAVAVSWCKEVSANFPVGVMPTPTM
jgi:hypothetical protein